MQITSSSVVLQDTLAAWRHEKRGIAFVPTMGNLHAGHLALIELAKQHAQRIVVSIFVNPLQFGPDEDFADYPRTLTDDCQQCQAVGADMVFTPSVELLYPKGEDLTRVLPPKRLAETLCGLYRPRFLSGVTTVVSKLFHLVQPDIALFGKKDYQQGLVIQHMVADLNFPIQIIMAETQREPDGLALSSRNQYLSKEERVLAPALYQQCQELKQALLAGQQDYDRLCKQASATLTAIGFHVDYVSIRKQSDLSLPDHSTKKLVILIAAWLGKARLIDNIDIELAT